MMVASAIGRGLRSLGDLWSAGWTTVGGFFGIGGYSATDPRRKILPYGLRPTNTTANELLTASLPGLRAYCRHLERNNPTARAMVEGWLCEIVNGGIALEPDTGDETTDARIRAVWQDFIRDCTVGGHDLYYQQAQGLRELSVAGELLWRLVVLPERAKAGKIPLAILPLESEWLDDSACTSGQPDTTGVTWVNGVGVDKYGRPVGYKLRPPGYGFIGTQESVPAGEIIHEFERRRSLQARGEPWMSPVIETLQQMRDLVDAELKAAVNCSAMAMVVTAEAHDVLDTTLDGSTTTDPAQSVRIGGIARMFPGEKVEAFSHNRPSQAIAPFLEMLQGQIAGGCRISQRWLDRNYKRANYSSMRTDCGDGISLHAGTREWFGHATAGRLYLAALPYLAVKAGIPMPRTNYRLLPEQQPYVDPVKDAMGDKLAIDSKFITRESIIAKRGGDYRQVQDQLAQEAIDDAMREIDRIEQIQIAVNKANAATPGLNLNWAQVATIAGAATAPGAYLAAASGNQELVNGPPETEADPNPKPANGTSK